LRHDAEDSNRRQQQRQRREQRQHPRANARAPHCVAYAFVHRLHLAERKVRIESADFGGDCRRERRGIETSPDEQAHAGLVRLRERNVNVRHRDGLDGAVANVRYDADHFGPDVKSSLADGDTLPDRILLRPDFARRRFVHEEHPGLARAIVLGEVPSPQHGDAES
jgi:hypothetical protein